MTQYCSLHEALQAARRDGYVMRAPTSGWRFMDAAQNLEDRFVGSPVGFEEVAGRREVLLPNGDRLTFVPAELAGS